MPNKVNSTERLTFVLPTFNESKNIIPLLKSILKLNSLYKLEIIVIDDNSSDGTSNLVSEFSEKYKQIILLNRFGRSGLSSAIKEGCLNARGEIIAVMDTDGQHEVKTIKNGIDKLLRNNMDLVIGSRFAKGSKIKGLSDRRKEGSSWANLFARISLSKNYAEISDYMSGCMIMRKDSCISYIKKLEVNGFKFLYELLSISNGKLKVSEVKLIFQPRKYGKSKLDLSIVWDFFISLVHTLFQRIIPRRAISFGFVGAIGVLVQLITNYLLMFFLNLTFERALPISVICAATSNYLINNSLTFRVNRLKNKALFKGLLKFLLVSSLPIIANVGLATSFYKNISTNTIFSQLAGIVVVFIWNYVASSKFVWNN